MSRWTLLALPLGLAIALAADGPRRYRPRPAPPAARAEALAFAARIDGVLEREWAARGLTPSPEVDDLAFARRLWLDLLGTVPSLEELRELEAWPPEGRRQRLIDRALADPRFASTLAEQLARVVVGANARPDDLLYRRRRLVDWLTQQVAAHRPWDALVRDLLTAEGLSTDTPAVNFVLSQERDPIKLAGRTARAFLGVRIDCAECHDHPYAAWKQADFEGLAAFFARLEPNTPGVRDRAAGELELDPGAATAMMGPARRRIAPAVPFDPTLLPAQEGERGRRRALAAWVTHPENATFTRAVANRVWAWLMGRGVVHPPDELDVTDPWSPALLDVLEAGAREGGLDLERLVRAVVSTRAYALSSALPGPAADEEAQLLSHATYPVEPLRPETLGRALYQATSFWTWDARRALLLRFARAGQVTDFVRRHGGDPDGEELDEETLLQRLHLLNGQLVHERTKDDDVFAPTTRLPLLAPTDEAALDAAFLMTLARRPTADEAAPWLARLAAPVAGDRNAARAATMSDLLWALLNTTEFVTKH
ncbi:MAG: DUF1549 and DUF1553 domain-containing protein [Planctomycetes bacterium]|nr:DUF1549 and DUF1553 domain-containing protein [Planctomycetota bacterium]